MKAPITYTPAHTLLFSSIKSNILTFRAVHMPYSIRMKLNSMASCPFHSTVESHFTFGGMILTISSFLPLSCIVTPLPYGITSSCHCFAVSPLLSPFQSPTSFAFFFFLPFFAFKQGNDPDCRTSPNFLHFSSSSSSKQRYTYICDNTWLPVTISFNNSFFVSKAKLGCAHRLIQTFKHIMRLFSLVITLAAVIGAWGVPYSSGGGQFEGPGVYGDVVPPKEP